MATPDSTMKCCTRRDQCIHPKAREGWLPATGEFFHNDKRTKDGLAHICKECACARTRKWNVDNPDRKYETRRVWSEANPDKVNASSMRYRICHPNYETERNKKRRREQPEKVYQYNKKYQRNNRNIYRVASQKHRTREMSLLNRFTRRDWEVCLDYFGGCCAVCGRPPGLWHVLAADHWIPLSNSNCPGTVSSNIVPLCHGVDGCNNSKSDQDAKRWLERRYGKRKGRQILKRIEDYFTWVVSMG